MVARRCGRWNGSAMQAAATVTQTQLVELLLHVAPVRHVFTHFVLELTLAEATTVDGPGGLWCAPEHFDRLALPSVMRKLLRQAGLTAGAVR